MSVPTNKTSLPYTTTTSCGKCAATLVEPEAWTPSNGTADMTWVCGECKHTTIERFARNRETSLYEFTTRYTFMATKSTGNADRRQ